MDGTQDRDYKTLQESFKQDMKLLKQGVDMLPKEMRKDALRQRKEEKDAEQAEKVCGNISFTHSCISFICSFFHSFIHLLIYPLTAVSRGSGYKFFVTMYSQPAIRIEHYMQKRYS